MNVVVLVGNLTKDVEVRKTNNGNSVANFTVAINEGADREATFVNCVAWNHTADFLANYAGKGDTVAVNGRLQNNNWEDEHGVMHYQDEVSAFRVELVRTVERDPQMTVQEEEKDEPVLDITGDDLPF